MVLQSHADLEFLAQLFDRVECVAQRLGNNGLNPHVLSELKRLATLSFVLRKPAHAVIHQLDTQIREPLLDFPRAAAGIASLTCTSGFAWLSF